MEQLVVCIFILGFIFLGEKTQNPIYNLASAGFCFYLAFTVGITVIMLVLIFIGLFQLVYIFNKFRN